MKAEPSRLIPRKLAASEGLRVGGARGKAEMGTL